MPSAPPLGLHHPFLKIQETCSWEQMTALRLGMGEPGCRSPFLAWGKREISSADRTGSAPLSSLGGFAFASAAHLSPSFLCLLLPWMKGSEEEPWNVTLRDCFDAGRGRAESLACDKPGVASTLLTCIGPAFSPLSHHSLASSSTTEILLGTTAWQLTKRNEADLAVPYPSPSLLGMPHVQIQDAELDGKWELCSWTLQKCN